MTSKSLKFPNVGHIGVVVKDIDRVIEYYSPVFGIGPFEIYDFRPHKAWVRGQEVRPFELRIATAGIGSANLELIQVVRVEPRIATSWRFVEKACNTLGFMWKTTMNGNLMQEKRG